MKGHLFVFSGPSGSGKGTVLERVFKRIDNLYYSVSYTTRAPRPGDVDGKQYFFIDRATFDRMIEKGCFLEWAEVHGNLYGTGKDRVYESLSAGHDVILEIDVQGALQIKEKMPEAITIFLAPPTLEELERRLKRRGTDTGSQIRLRLENAKKELTFAGCYDNIVVNDDLKKAVSSVVTTIEKYREETQ